MKEEGKSDLGHSRRSNGFQHLPSSQIGVTWNNNVTSTLLNTSSNRKNLGVDRQSIAQFYRNLRENQKQILSGINMAEINKRKLFGFPESYYCTNQFHKVKLFSVLDPFKGRLIMKEEEWKKLDKEILEKQLGQSYKIDENIETNFDLNNKSEGNKSQSRNQNKVNNDLKNKGDKTNEKKDSSGSKKRNVNQSKVLNNQEQLNMSNTEKNILKLLSKEPSDIQEFQAMMKKQNSNISQIFGNDQICNSQINIKDKKREIYKLE